MHVSVHIVCVMIYLIKLLWEYFFCLKISLEKSRKNDHLFY